MPAEELALARAGSIAAVPAGRAPGSPGYRAAADGAAADGAAADGAAADGAAADGAPLGDRQGLWDDPADLEDVVACYRLLLGREADTEGLAHYRERLAEGGASVGDLVKEFIGSVEFVRAHRLGRPGAAPASEAVRTVEGFLLHVDPTDYAVGHTISLTGVYEPDVTATVRSLLREGATFVDAGANMGWFSMLAAGLVGPTGRVVAVEPNPTNCALARRSAEDNGFSNVQVFTAALADRAGAVALETDGSNGRVVPVDGPPPEPVPASFVVAACTLDSLLEGAGVAHVDAVKVDVEGAEPLVLLGAAGMLARDRPALVSEFYPLALDSSPWGSAQGYLDHLRRLGYRLCVIGPGMDPSHDEDDATLLSLAKEGKGQLDLLALPL